MKQFLILSLLVVQSVYGDGALEKYFSYLELLSQDRGNFREGEIEIVIDPKEIAQVQAVQQGRLLKKGLSKRHALDLLWAFTGRDLYRMLVIEQSWSSHRYEGWLGKHLAETLLESHSLS